MVGDRMNLGTRMADFVIDRNLYWGSPMKYLGLYLWRADNWPRNCSGLVDTVKAVIRGASEDHTLRPLPQKHWTKDNDHLYRKVHAYWRCFVGLCLALFHEHGHHPTENSCLYRRKTSEVRSLSKSDRILCMLQA